MEEEEEHRGGQDHPEEDAPPRVVDRRLDEFARVAEPHQPHAAGQFAGGVDFVVALPDRPDHLDRVGFALLDDVEGDGGFAVDEGAVADLLAAHLDAPDVAQIDAAAVDRNDLDVEDVVEVLVFAVEDDVLLGLADLDPADRRFEVVLLDRAAHVIHRHVGEREFRPVDEDVELHLVGAEDPHLADAGDRREAVGEHVVGVVVEFVDGDVAGEEEPHHRGRVVVDLADRRVLDPVGEVVADAVQPLADVGRGDVDVDPHVEFDRDRRHVLQTERRDVLDAVDRRHRVLDAAGDFDLDLLGAGAVVFAADQHVGDVETRHQVDAQFAVGIRPQHDEDDDERRHRDRPVDRPLAQEHGVSPR